MMSGWEDGYKNPVETVVDGLAHIGKEVTGLIGPWGRKYPLNARILARERGYASRTTYT